MNTFDLIGAMELTGSAAILVASLAAGLGRTARTRRGLITAFGAWFGAIVLLAALGAFDTRHGLGVSGIGAAVALPLAVLLGVAIRSAPCRSAIARVPLTLLISLNTVRVLGISVILLYAAGRLLAPFAPVAGWGDIFIGVTALPVAWLGGRTSSESRILVLAWNALGLLDLLAAVGLGVASAPDSPVRLFVAEPGTRIMSTLPWILIPGFLVPILMLTHFAIFWKVRVSSPPAERDAAAVA